VRAAFHTEQGSVDVLRVDELPAPAPGPTDVLIRVQAAALDRVDVYWREGSHGSGDFHPLHCDDVYARRRGYPGVFAHGMYTMGMSGRAVTDVVGHERVLAFGGRITGQVWPGDTLTARARVTDVYDDTRGTVADVAVTTTNGHGAAVFDGTATVRTA